jgi:hypothetical protein
MMIMLFLLYFIGSAAATPISLDGRQIAVPQASQSGGVDDNTAAIPLSAIIAISTILGVGIIMVAFVSTTRMLKRSELTGQNNIVDGNAKSHYVKPKVFMLRPSSPSLQKI